MGGTESGEFDGKTVSAADAHVEELIENCDLATVLAYAAMRLAPPPSALWPVPTTDTNRPTTRAVERPTSPSVAESSVVEAHPRRRTA
jgi:hypothetical protein